MDSETVRDLIKMLRQGRPTNPAVSSGLEGYRLDSPVGLAGAEAAFARIENREVRYRAAEELGEGKAREAIRLEAYAWVVVRRMAAVRLRHEAWTVDIMTLDDHPGTRPEDRWASVVGTPEQIEARLFYAQLFRRLTPEKQHVLRGKQAGLSVEEIGARHDLSGRRVATTWRRVKFEPVKTRRSNAES